MCNKKSGVGKMELMFKEADTGINNELPSETCEIRHLMAYNKKIINDNGFTDEQVANIVDRVCRKRAASYRRY